MTAWLALWVFLTSAGLQFTSVEFTNDHFDRISRARQIAEYGELPFRDFLDAGYFATLYSSALLQRLVEDSRIEDTAGLDRGTFSVTALPEPDWERWRCSLPLLRRVQVLPGVFSQQNAVTWWYYVLVAVPLISVATLSFSRFRAPGPGGTGVHAKVLSAAALCGAVDAFILRDPIQARAGAVTCRRRSEPDADQTRSAPFRRCPDQSQHVRRVQERVSVRRSISQTPL